jgi:hypothetical protein
MTDGVVFGIGGVLFIVTTWATIAFLMSKFIELQREDVLASPEVSGIVSDTFTDVRVSRPQADS